MVKKKMMLVESSRIFRLNKKVFIDVQNLRLFSFFTFLYAVFIIEAQIIDFEKD